MSYSYATPLSYGNQAPISYEEMSVQAPEQYQQQPVAKKPSSLPAAAAGAGAGLLTGVLIGVNKNPYMENGVPKDTFTKAAYEKYIKKAEEAEKNKYGQHKNVLKKLDKVKSAEELRSLLHSNPRAAEELGGIAGGTSEEYLNRITDKTLSANKKAIKGKLESSNKFFYDDMGNIISDCWDAEKKKFVKTDSTDAKAFKAIKKASGRIKAEFLAKYGIIAAAIGGVVAFAAHKIYVYKKSASQQ